MYRWGTSMASITIRNLDDEVKARLRVRAAHSGRSMEEEVRLILRAVVEPENVPAKGLGTAIHELFKPFRGFELELPPASRCASCPASIEAVPDGETRHELRGKFRTRGHAPETPDLRSQGVASDRRGKRSNSEAVATSPFRLKLLRYSSTVNGGDFRRLRTLRVAAQKTLGTELRWP